MNKKLTYDQKLEIVAKFASDPKSVRKLSIDYNTSKSTIARILANKDKYGTKLVRIDPIDEKDNLLSQTLKYRELDSVVFEVFLKLRTKLIGINGTLLKKVGLHAAKQLKLNEFKASNGWVDRFRTRHGLQFKSISGEIKSCDMSEIPTFQNIIVEKFKIYEPKDIWNCDETGLQYKNPPAKSYVTKEDDCKGAKQRKERITILFCCNLLGEKYPPLIIGKSKSPRCMKNFDMQKINVRYLSSNNAWMTSELFIRWVHDLNEEMVSQKRKILLILDNAPCHISHNCSAIEFLFLPKNTTAILQPLDMGVIKAFKNHYFNVLIESFLCDLENIDPKCFGKIDLKDVSIMTSIAWDKVSAETITNCFKKAIESCKNCEIAEVEDDHSDEEISQVVMQAITEIAEDNSESSESSETYCTDDMSNELKNAVNALKITETCTRSLAPDSLKHFYMFKMDFLKNLRRQHGFGNKITDYFDIRIE